MYGYYYESNYLIFMIISMIISSYAHFKVQHNFNKYSKISCDSQITGKETVIEVLKYNNVNNIEVENTKGFFTDYFDSRNRKICLSNDVYNKKTIASVSVAAHESGHAVQNEIGYLPLKLRHLLVPITQFGSSISMPLIFIGLLIPNFNFAIQLGILFFSIAVFFQIVTLPVEFDASRRALESIKSTGILNDEEIKGAKKVLKAAALTYVASAFTAILSLLRIILISRNRKN